MREEETREYGWATMGGELGGSRQRRRALTPSQIPFSIKEHSVPDTRVVRVHRSIRGGRAAPATPLAVVQEEEGRLLPVSLAQFRRAPSAPFAAVRQAPEKGTGRTALWHAADQGAAWGTGRTANLRRSTRNHLSHAAGPPSSGREIIPRCRSSLPFLLSVVAASITA